MGNINYLKVTIISFISWLISYFQPILGVACIFLVFFSVDFATGLLASFKRGEKFRSSKARESFFKLLVYVGTFAFIIAMGRELNRIDGSEGIGNMTSILKIVIYVAIWFEAKSNAENLKIIFPTNRFISFLDYILGVEFVNKITWLKGFLDKEKKDE